MLRSALAILVGYLVLAVLISGLFVAWALASGYRHTPGTTPSLVFLVAAELWGVLAATAGAWVTVRVARGNPWGHGAALLVVSWLMGYVSLIAGDGREPLAIQISHFVILLAGVLAGTAAGARRGAPARDGSASAGP
ncbi:MAG: hypothetical protein AAF682_31510 [Planctomycetota bacterium]